MDPLIASPDFPVAGQFRFRISPRPKPSYFNAIPAAELLDTTGAQVMEMQVSSSGPDGASREGVVFRLEYPLARGRIIETVRLLATPQGLDPVAFDRAVLTSTGLEVRRETANFADRTIPLPPNAYPEVLLPFLLGWMPFDGKTRSLFAWITDRFIARVRYRSTGKEVLQTAAGKVDALEVIMYPDFNDWVRLGSFLSHLVSPFIPKYRMWYRPAPPHHLVRFEGSYGPPGSPEIILESSADDRPQ
jgi:hypothetical protein